MAFSLDDVDSTWTLFLDRDGVLNKEIEGSYILEPDQLQLYEGVVESLATLAARFGRVIIVTNQRCIGKGMLSEGTFHDIMQKLIVEIEAGGGRIDAYYFAPEIESAAYNRKPNIGMADQAKHDFPEIDFSKSIMIGNNVSDIEFAKRLGMKAIFLTTTKSEVPSEISSDILISADSLYRWINPINL